MKAYVYGANGAEITDVAKPTPKGSQVLVKVQACGLNRADLGMTKGHVHGAAGPFHAEHGADAAGRAMDMALGHAKIGTVEAAGMDLDQHLRALR